MLRHSVMDLENQLRIEQEIIRMRLYQNGPNVWEERMKEEKRKREDAEEEFAWLNATIQDQANLIRLYRDRLVSITEKHRIRLMNDEDGSDIRNTNHPHIISG